MIVLEKFRKNSDVDYCSALELSYWQHCFGLCLCTNCIDFSGYPIDILYWYILLYGVEAQFTLICTEYVCADSSKTSLICLLWKHCCCRCFSGRVEFILWLLKTFAYQGHQVLLFTFFLDFPFIGQFANSK